MDGGDRCIGGVRHDEDDKMIINQIMQRFRPIAPKLSPEGPVSGHSDLENKKTVILTKNRPKRKYVRVNKTVRNNCKKNNSKARQQCSDWYGGTAVTLELLPEIGKSSLEGRISKDLELSGVQQLPRCLNLNFAAGNDYCLSDLSVVETWVTVECVKDTSADLGGMLGRTDGEMVRNLEVDTCPGFVSDGFDVVRWVNLAYRRMVAGPVEGGGPPAEVVVRLVVKERFPAEKGAFSCRVTVVCVGKSTKTVPCDVWRMEFGGLAWRLDLQAALSLGR